MYRRRNLWRNEQTYATLYPHKTVRGLKFRIEEIEGLYYLWDENKGDDQQCDDFAAYPHLYCRICKNQIYTGRGSFSKPELLGYTFFSSWSMYRGSKYLYRSKTEIPTSKVSVEPCRAAGM